MPEHRPLVQELSIDLCTYSQLRFPKNRGSNTDTIGLHTHLALQASGSRCIFDTSGSYFVCHSRQSTDVHLTEGKLLVESQPHFLPPGDVGTTKERWLGCNTEGKEARQRTCQAAVTCSTRSQAGSSGRFPRHLEIASFWQPGSQN